MDKCGQKIMIKKIYLLALLLWPGLTFAGFAVVEEAPKPATPPAAAKDAGPAANVVATPQDKFLSTIELVAVNYVGPPDKEIETRNGFGRDVRLVDAYKQIVPAGWSVLFSDSLAGKLDKRTVTWRGGRRWVEILDIVSNDQNLSVDVIWARKQIVVQERRATTSSVTRAAPPPVPVWIGRSGATLRETVSEWAQKAGWEMRWLQDDLDYRLPGRLTYEGTFENAIISIFRTYEDADRPMHADGNPKQKLLLIRERKK